MEGRERHSVNPTEIPETEVSETNPFENPQPIKQEAVADFETSEVQSVSVVHPELTESPETTKSVTVANLEIPSQDSAPSQAELDIESIMQHSLEGFTDG